MKFFEKLKKIYGIFMLISFFGAALPIIPFIVALIIGGKTGEAVATFLSDKYYPVIMVLACVAVVVGVVAMYVSRRHEFSLKTLGKKKEK